MKTTRFISLLLVLLCARAIASDASNEVFLPSMFKSVDSVETYIKATPLGGEVHLLRAGDEDVLVVQFHADKESDLAIVVYLFLDGKWQATRMWSIKNREAHKVIVVNREVVAVGLSSGERSTLLEAKEKRANQALQHNDPSCHVSCLRTSRASWGRG